MSNPKKTKVILNDTDITDFVLEWNYDVTYTDSYITSVSLLLANSVNNVISTTETDLLRKESYIEIYRGVTTADTILFKGVIAEIKYGKSQINLLCYDKLYITKKRKITYSYDKDIDPSAGVVSEIFKDIITRKTDLVVDTDSVQYSGTVNILNKFICKSESVFDKCKDLAEAIGWIFYYNPETDKVYFEPKGYVNNEYVINSAQNVTNPIIWRVDETSVFNTLELQGAEKEVSTIETGRIGTTPGYTTSEIQLSNEPKIVRVLCGASNPPTTERTIGVRNKDVDFDAYVDENKRQIVWNTSVYTPGASDYVIVEYTYLKSVPIFATDYDSVDLYDIKDKTIFRTDITEVKDAELYALEYINDYKDPVRSATVSVVNIPNLYPGQKILVIDDLHNINDVFFITRVTKKYPFTADVVEITSKIQGEENYLFYVSKKLRELDRYNKVDFTSLIHSYPLYNPYIYENEYVSITKNGTDIYRAYNYNNYIETFVNTDLKNISETTGMWIDGVVGAYLFKDNVLVSERFILANYVTNNNYYKKLNVSIEGSGLDDITFYLGEDNGTTINYSEVNLTGPATKKTGSVLTSNSNKNGVVWKINRTDDPDYTYNYEIKDYPFLNGITLSVSQFGEYILWAGAGKVRVLKKIDNNEYELLDLHNVFNYPYGGLATGDIAKDASFAITVYATKWGAPTTGFIYILKRNGDFFNYLQEIEYPTTGTSTNMCSISNDGNYFALGTSAGDYLYWYKKGIDGKFTALSAPATLPPTGVVGLKWSNNGNYLAVTGSFGLIIYKRTGDTITKLADPSEQPSPGASCAWTKDDKYLAISSYSGTDKLAIYERTNDDFELYLKPSIVNTGTVRPVIYSSDDKVLFLASTSGTRLAAYDVTNNYTNIPDYFSDTTLDNTFNSIIITNNDLTFVACTYAVYPGIKFYRKDYKKISKIDIKYEVSL